MAGNREQGTRLRERPREPATLSISDANFLWSRTLFNTLVALGVENVVVSSGARCAPLVLAASLTPELTVHTHPDERSAGFRALGMAKFSRRPVALVCTSGTAGANYHPAVIEARMSHVPLVVLTADRPPELRGTGAPQTIDQIDLYGRHVLAFRDLDPPSPAVDGESWAEAAVEAVTVALTDPVGPVHLNVPFREPLIPDPKRLEHLRDQFAAQGHYPLQRHGTRRPPVSWEDIAAGIADQERGVIVCGPEAGGEDFLTALVRLSGSTGYPVLADPTSGVRFTAKTGLPVVAYYDLLLLNNDLAERLRPEVVIRFGGLPTSKRLNEWLLAIPKRRHIVIDSHSEIADPHGAGGWKIVSSPEEACIALSRQWNAGPSRVDFATAWIDAQQRLENILTPMWEELDVAFEGDIAARTIRDTPDQAIVFLSSSLPIRLVDAYAGVRSGLMRVIANRGANGIDGVVSTAAGIAAVSNKPVILLVGDVAFLHDANALLGVSRDHLDLKIVLLNNDGGGIFSFLPLAEHTDTLETLVAMPHGRDFAKWAGFFDVPYACTTDAKSFEVQFRKALESAGPAIIEVRTSRAHTLAVNREIQRRVAGARLVD